MLVSVCKPVTKAWKAIGDQLQVESMQVELGLSFEGEGVNLRVASKGRCQSRGDDHGHAAQIVTGRRRVSAGLIMIADRSVLLVTSANPGTAAFGTAFFTGRDAGGRAYVVTCAHVVKDVGGADSVNIGGKSARVIAMGSPRGRRHRRPGDRCAW